MPNPNHRSSRSPPRLRINPPSPQSFYSLSPLFTPSTFTSSAASIKTPKATSTATTPIVPTNSITTLSLDTVIAHLRITLHPLISATTGLQHPYFPRTLLSYHLLTSDQLDELARHYHQVTPPVPGTFSYPVAIPAWVDAHVHAHGNEYMMDEVDLKTKRRRFGRFIGLRGCESPIQFRVELDSESGSESGYEDAEMEEAMARVEWEWEEALLRAVREDGDGFRIK
ncbi:uncharacterized protein EURHEDRAFT_43256 [Aspergillus ruber CBS 135680]|uniref:Uncharacterized protein n=1 Tax=Aspergillus ruber (strain CBS 135680) TaxID=1388766 RepID=A0A017SG73_ASPRC|nr:uncharacterized protein EURHEDRAFT_43256 [Aspergillus ruber CBS 135680]EYE95983.1 hypothetical protein EURHEDRAFT_43256 [Aspergillus ruber CBS 135680]